MRFAKRMFDWGLLAGTRAAAVSLQASGFLEEPQLHVHIKRAGRSYQFMLLSLSKVGRMQLDAEAISSLRRDFRHLDAARIWFKSLGYPGRGRACLVTDSPENAPAGNYERRVILDYDYFRTDNPPDTLIAPYFFHPGHYYSGAHRRVRHFRNPKRSIRILFAGAQNREFYTRSFAFDMMNRWEILSALQEDFSDQLLVIRRREDVALVEERRAPIVMIVTDQAGHSPEHVLSGDEYWRLLGRAAFALCPPGCHMPHAHNAIEALAAGSVPIIPYADYLTPPLRDGANCLAFSTREELKSAVSRALSMSESEAEMMRQAAAAHYDQCLSPAAFGARIKTFLREQHGDLTIRVNEEETSVRMMRSRRGISTLTLEPQRRN